MILITNIMFESPECTYIGPAQYSHFLRCIEYICTEINTQTLKQINLTFTPVLSQFGIRRCLRTSIGWKSLTMSPKRVKSKNLFNFRPQGFIDPDVVLYDEKMKNDFGLDPEAMEEAMKSQTDEEFAGGMRATMDAFLGQPFCTDPAIIEVWFGTIDHSLFCHLRPS